MRPRRLLRWLRRLAFVVAIAALGVLAARLSFPLPPLDGRVPSQAIAASESTALGAGISLVAAEHPGLSGVASLRRGPDAFGARVTLARAAESSIDAQYYIWQRDVTGFLLLDELRAAAERGVRVRLLLDDVGTAGLDAELAALDALPNFEVRLFNPFTLRTLRSAGYLFDVVRLNRRMHNKAFTVDGAVTIVGGRNVGDIYFARAAEGHYSDFDVLAVGPAAAEVSTDFDAYWASASAYPVNLLVEPSEGGLDSLREAVAGAASDPAAEVFLDAVEASTLVPGLKAGAAGLDWVAARLLSDDPAKALGLAGKDEILMARLSEEMGRSARGLDLISAYFIPGRRGAALLAGLAEQGLRVRILTNSLESTDVPPVHSGYVEYRDELLDAGVELYEMKSTTVPREDADHFGVLASATSSLHAKVLTIDGERVFVGSFNFDPRSFFLNCEMGILIDSVAIASEFDGIFDERVRVNAYRVIRAEDGGTEWIETLPDGGEVTYGSEPRTTFLERAAVAVIGWLPVDWML
ncbi:phospholipase D family protein [Ostreiculturibacter nitratireducens]|uniref:phospholipase D-like domain-containing protein n=1 Tax=Ostreiculturibacter nitratireducens TaxID=3075226 RepID=UPI0031B5FF8D